MSKVLVSEENLTNIANAIREKNGTSDTYKPSDMAEAIQNISSSGSTVTKGIIINEFDEQGYATDVSIVGFTEIPEYYFYNTIGHTNTTTKRLFLSATVHLPDNTIKIGQYAFANCTDVNVNLPDEITEIGNSAFLNSWVRVAELPSKLTKIGNSAFEGCSNIEISKLPEGLISMGAATFESCKGITTMEIPSGIIKIYSSTFKSCSNLEKVIYKGDLVQIYNDAFRYANKLTTVILSNVTSVPILGTNVFGSTEISNGTGYIYVPDDLVESFKTATNWSTYADQIKPISELEANA